MAIVLTPKILEGAYEFLRTTPPFYRWKLPSGASIRFSVVRDPNLRGFYRRRKDGLVDIAISARATGHTDTLIETMAHEMIHLYQDIHGQARDGQHNAGWKRAAERVCKVHGFDPKAFE